MFSDFSRFVSVTPQENRTTESSGSLPGWFSVLGSACQLPTRAFLCCQYSLSHPLSIQKTLIFPSLISSWLFLLLEALTSYFFFKPFLLPGQCISLHTTCTWSPIHSCILFQSPLTVSSQIPLLRTSCWYCSRWYFREKGSDAQLRWTGLKLQIEIKFSRYDEVVCIRCHTNLETDLRHLEPMLLLVTDLRITEKKLFLLVPL